MRYYIIIFFVLFLPQEGFSAQCSATIPQGTTESCNPVVQHGITWTFSTDRTVGQFINGDYWVVDSGSGVAITGITPGYTDTPRAMNGSMLNPSSHIQGYDGGISYNASVNVGIGITPSTPLTLSGDVSLVSTISNLDGGVSNKPYVNTAAVLTCLSSPPPSGSFRPGISSTTKTLHNIASINYSKLKSLALPSGQTRPSIATYAAYLQIVFLNHGADPLVLYIHPTASGLDKYYFPEKFADVALMLNLDYTNDEKLPLLKNFIQLGIDHYSFLESGSSWPPNGGHMSGRKFPILFTGIVLGYAPMVDVWQKSGDYLYSDGHGPGNPPADYVYGGNEDGQTFYVAQSDVDITNSASWNPDTRYHTAMPYTSAMIGMPEWGIVYALYPQNSDSSWRAIYREVANNGANTWTGTALAARIMGAKTLWNHNAYFDYVDRYVAITRGQSDPFGYVVTDEGGGYPLPYPPWGLTSAMWDEYRAQFPDARRAGTIGGRVQLIEGRPQSSTATQN